MALPNKPSIKNVWATSGLIVEPSEGKVDTGWIVERPPHQFQNWLQNRSDQFIKHVNEAGIPAWDAVTVYTANRSYAQGSDGKIYKCLTDGANKNPVGNPTNWGLTFGDLDLQGYVDDAAGSAADAAASAAAALASQIAAAASATTAGNARDAAVIAKDQAVSSASAASGSATAAATSASNAATSETNAQTAYEGSQEIWEELEAILLAGPVMHVNGRTGDVVLTAADVGLENANNTSDADKPLSTAATAALNSKANLATTVTKDSNTGAANLPTGTTAQRPASPLGGMFRFNSDLFRFEGYQGSSWGSLGGATGGGSDAAFYLNDNTINNDYTIPSGQNAGTFGPVTIASGKTVTVSSGSTWSIV